MDSSAQFELPPLEAGHASDPVAALRAKPAIHQTKPSRFVFRENEPLTHEWKKDMLRLWIPLVAGSALLLGIFLGLGARGSLESSSKSATPAIQIPADSPNESTPPQHSNQGHISSRARHER